MKIRTVNDLDDALSDEVAWRKRELINLKLLHDKSRDHQQLMLRRAGIALLYAHWEGNVKNSSRAYLNFVLSQGKNAGDLRSSLLGLSIKGDLVDQLRSSTRGAVLESVGEFVHDKVNKRALFDPERSIRTKSNLSSEVFQEIVRLLGLDYSTYVIYEKTVIDRILELRNKIAHGEHVDVDGDDYSRLNERVFFLLELFKSQLTNSAEKNLYLKN